MPHPGSVARRSSDHARQHPDRRARRLQRGRGGPPARGSRRHSQAWPATELGTAFETFDVLWFRLGYRLDAGTFSHAGRCKLVATAVTGLDHIDVEAADRCGVKVISLRGETEFLQEVRATAELTIGLAIALLRHLPAAANDVLSGHWDRDGFRGRELYRKTAGVVGVGRLGLIVAGYLRALGMTVLGYDPIHPGSDSIEMVDDLRRPLLSIRPGHRACPVRPVDTPPGGRRASCRRSRRGRY